MSLPPPISAPVLSTPDTHIFEDPTPAIDTTAPRLSDEQVAITYEIERTVREIRQGRWKRIALQFPDQMLVDAARVYEQLGRGLAETKGRKDGVKTEVEEVSEQVESLHVGEEEEERLFILGDTSYGACCVDEVAAEHVDADVIVHYGRSCLSPPSRLPVIYVFTARPLDLDATVSDFEATFPDRTSKVLLMADTPYAHHIPTLHTRLESLGYESLFATQIQHNPSSLLPNRTTPPDTSSNPQALQSWSLFHISTPPDALLLTLASRVAKTHIHPTHASAPERTNTSALLRRRYALISTLSTTPIIGILLNTLSVQNYMLMLSQLQRLIAAAGKKSYTFVVGKVNGAKVANFSEVGGWVVIGCWESSLFANERGEFWRPVVTPFELGIALGGAWTGEWSGDFESFLNGDRKVAAAAKKEEADDVQPATADAHLDDTADFSDEESAPPEFDLRTGRYVSHSRPMASSASASASAARSPSTLHPTSTSTSTSSTTADASANTVARRATGALASINGVVSPGAEYLRSGRSWVGLGSDYHDADAEEGEGEKRAAKMEEGRRGIARGYRVGGDAEH